MTQPDFAAIRADQVADALAKIEARPDWVEATYPDNFVLLHKREAAALVEVAKAATNLAAQDGHRDDVCDDCGLGGHTAPCPWQRVDAALDALTKAVEG